MPRNAMTTRWEIEDLLNKGFSQTEIAVMKDMTKQGVNWHLKHYGYRSPLEVAMDNLPWPNIESEHKLATPYHRVINHLEYTATDGKGMSASKLGRLRAWYERLAEYDIVVVYDPKLPPKPGIKSGGWDYVPRKDKDEDLMIRVNRHTKLTPEGRELWRMPDPDEWPDV